MAITAKEVQIKELSFPYELLDFNMKLSPNAHGSAYLKLRLREWINVAQELPYDSKLEICCTSDGQEKTLFYGIVNDAELSRKDQYYELFIRLVTASVRLDREKKIRAFQDTDMTYGQVLDTALSDTKRAGMVLTVEDKNIPYMLVQYEETDWEFSKRLASHFHSAMFPDWQAGIPGIYIGTAIQGKEMNIPAYDYAVILDERFYAEGGIQAGFKKSDFVYYEVKSDQNFNPGDHMFLAEKDQRIIKKHAIFKDAELIFTYTFGTVYPVRKYDNERLIGAWLQGTVLETEKENVRIQLDCDAVEPACTYPWTPVTGNHFHCMPEVGTRVSLYFGGANERTAKCLENIRENGASCPKTQNPENRYFGSQHGKELAVLPDSLTFGPRDAGPKISIDDNAGISITDKVFSIRAKGPVVFEGDQVNVTAPSQVSMIRSGKGPACTFNVSQDFNASGTVGSMKGIGRSLPRLRKSTEEVKPEDSKELELAALSCMMTGMTEKISIADIPAMPDNTAVSEQVLDLDLASCVLGTVPVGRTAKIEVKRKS